MVLSLILTVVLGAAIAGAAAGIVTAVKRITYTLIMDFFLSRWRHVRDNPGLVRVTADVTSAIQGGDVKRIHTGLFDQVRQEFVESSIYESSSVDPVIARAHGDRKVVIWD
jgi:hypothetical protein